MEKKAKKLTKTEELDVRLNELDIKLELLESQITRKERQAACEHEYLTVIIDSDGWYGDAKCVECGKAFMKKDKARCWSARRVRRSFIPKE